MVKPRLDSDLHNEILSRGSFSMNGCVVVSFPFTHLPGVFPIWPQPPFHLLFHLVSVRIEKLWAHLPVGCSWGLGPLDSASSPVFCPVRDPPPRAGRCVPSKIRVPSTPSQRTCSQVLCPLLGKAPWEAFLTFRPVSAQSWPHAHENHFLPGCLPSWAPWVQPGWRLCTPDPEAM